MISHYLNHPLILLFISVLFSYILGLTIVNVVNRHMSNISINMPKVEPHINFDVSKDLKGTININKKTKSNVIKENFEISKNSKNSKNCVKIGCNNDQDCNQIYSGNVCKSDNTCYCINGSGTFCHKGPTNYKDPKDMTTNELKKFKSKFRKNFTLQDYKNWLLLYKNDPQHLRCHHRNNLKKLLRGDNLTVKDIPTVKLTPDMTTSDYFNKMYNKNARSNIYTDDTTGDGNLLGFNYSEYDEFIPPELLEKTWITGIVDLYDDRHDATALNHFIRPESNTGAKETQIGDNYKSTIRNHLEKDGKLDGLTEKQIAQVLDMFKGKAKVC